MGIQPSTVAAFSEHIDGLHREVWQNAKPALLRDSAVPFYSLSSDIGEYNYLNRTGGFLPDSSDLPSGNEGYGDSYGQTNFNFAKATVTTKVWNGKLVKIFGREQDILASMNGSLDKERGAVLLNDGIIASALVSNFKTVAAGLSATTVNSGTWGIATATFDLRDALLRLMEETLVPIDTWVIGKGAARVLSNLNAVTQTANTVGGTSVSRVGQDQPGNFVDNYALLKSYILDNFGIKLVVEDTRLNTAGTIGYQLTTDGYFLCSNDPSNKTMLLCGDPREGEGLIRYDVRELSLPDKEGIGVAADARFGYNLINSGSGRKVTLTLS